MHIRHIYDFVFKNTSPLKQVDWGPYFLELALVARPSFESLPAGRPNGDDSL